MKVLVLGGTQFVGRHLTAKLLQAGHQVTLLNRGKTNPGLFGTSEQSSLRLFLADRDDIQFGNRLVELFELESYFDAVVDMCAYYPASVDLLLSRLKNHAGHYIQISSVSVYAGLQTGDLRMFREDSSVLGCTSAQALDKSMLTYGERKAECERRALAQSKTGIPVTIFRPSLIYGPFDPTDRFPYWIWKVAQKKPFIFPDDGLCILQKTFGPDLAEVLGKCLGHPEMFHRIYNVAETELQNWREVLNQIGDFLRIDPFDFAVSVPSEKLIEKKVLPWNDLPLWMPQTNLLVDTFSLRRDLEYRETLPKVALAAACEFFLADNRPPKAGIARERELEVLKVLGYAQDE